LTHHPFARRSRRRRRRNFPRAPRRHASARDRPVVPNQSAVSGHCGPRFTLWPDTVGPTPAIAAAAHAEVRCHPERRAPLLRFSGPFSVRWPRRVLSFCRAAGPADNPASTLPRDTRAVPKNGPVSRNSPLRVSASESGRDVEVLGVAEERGWASGRIGTNAPLSTHRSGRRPVAGSRHRDDRAVRGRPVDPEPSHSRPTRPHASAAASHPPPMPGHAPPRSLARCSATRMRGPCNARPGRTSWSFPHLVRRRSWGSVRSTLRRFAPADRWCDTFPCDRARVSFVPPRPPDLFSSGGRLPTGVRVG